MAIFTQDIRVVEELNSFFSNIFQTKIPEYCETKSLAEDSKRNLKISTKI